jgi:outer membrane protein assembly factor BamB
MKISSPLLVAVLGSVVCACSGSGSSSPSTTISGWEKFRQNPNNTGLAGGSVASNNGHKQSVQIDDGATPSVISSSPAISSDGATVYVASEGGTLAALPRAFGTPRWKVTACGACPQGQQALGTLLSSPAIYTLTGQSNDPLNNQTTIFIGSSNGSVFAFQDAGGSQVSCTGCFQPSPGSGAAVSFLSSPSFTTDSVVGSVNGVFIGAHIDWPNGRSTGKLYALNRNGTLNWEFPRPGDPDIGAVTSSPALNGSATTVVGTTTGTGNTWYFTAADDYLYALTSDGALKWKSPIGHVVDPDPTVPLAISPITSSSAVIAGTADGVIYALNQDGSPLWRSAPTSSGFAGSLAAGGSGVETPSATPVGTLVPTATPTPQPVSGAATSTPTVTPTFVPVSFLYAVTKSGEVIGFNIYMPTPTVIPVTGPIASPVLSSPALSADAYLVFGTADGTLHAVNTATGAEPSGWPVKLTNGTPIRSSPSIANDGIVYVGADDGMLYAVGLP